MEVRPGYKQTEVGVIPKEWSLVEYVSFGKVIDGDRGIHYPSVGDLRDGGYCLFLNAGNVTKSGFRFDECQFITAEKDKKLNNGRLVRGDVVLTTRGTVGNFAYFGDEVPYEIIRINSGMVILRNASPTVVNTYQYLVFQSRALEAQIERLSFGSAQPQLTVKGISTLKIPLPPTTAEQEAIAEALSDVDALLDALDRLLKKKRGLKQAAMQQLLTGQTRLPGFEVEWEVTTLGDLGSTFGGLTGKTKADFGDGSGQYIPFMNIMTNVVIDCDALEQVKISPRESQNRVVKGDLLLNGSSETPEEVAMCAVLAADVQDLFLNSFCFGFRFRDGAEADGLFLAYYLRSKEGRELMKSLAQGSTRYNLSKAALLKSPVRLPALAEQTAIASVLKDMDAELAALEQRLTKTRDIKQGMMQELLTGKTRLFTPEASHA